VGAVAALLAALASRAGADEEPCPASAIVTGDEELVGQARADLARRGVVSVPPAGCRRVRANIQRRREHLLVSVEDGYGRKSEREVRDLATATALVESWTRQEVVVAMLPPEPVEHADPPPPVVIAAAAPAAAVPLGAGVGLATEMSRATDDSTWVGASLSGCAGFGPVCAGGLLRGAVDSRWSGDGSHSRRGADLYATAAVPLEAGGMTIAPGLVLGLGWIQVAELGPHHDQTDDTGGVRAGAEVRLSRALGAGFSLGLTLSVDRFVLGGDATGADGAAIAPTGQFRGGLGLRYGGH
jgi:hypothetical protein